MAKDPKKPSETLPSPTFELGKHGKGWIEDPKDARDWSARAMLGAPLRRGALRESLFLVDHLRTIHNQKKKNSCTGEAFRTAIDTRLRAIGVKMEEPSSDGIYTIGRAMARKDASIALSDDGAFPRSVAKGLKEYGVPGVSAWPIGDETNINNEPTQEMLTAASAGKISAWSRVDTKGEGRAADVDHALSQKYPVALGIQVDRGFEDYDGKRDITLPEGENFGGHMLCLLGFKTNPDGSKSYLGVNSWGTGWGLKGMFWMHETRLVHPTTSDIYIVQVSG